MHSETVEEIDQQIMQLELYLLLIGGRRLDVQHEIRMKLKELYAEKKNNVDYIVKEFLFEYNIFG